MSQLQTRSPEFALGIRGYDCARRSAPKRLIGGSDEPVELPAVTDELDET